MKNICLFLGMILIIISSCTKDVTQENNTTVINKIKIGEPDPSITIKYINPDTTLESYYQELNFPIDINSDGINDFDISAYCNYIFGGSVLQQCRLRIKTFNNDSYILTDSIYPSATFDANNTFVSQSLVDSLYPKVIYKDSIITINDMWKKGDFNLLSSNGNLLPPNGSGYTTYLGAWKDLDQKYVAIRYKNNLGWIKIGILYNKYLKIYEYALSNQ